MSLAACSQGHETCWPHACPVCLAIRHPWSPRKPDATPKPSPPTKPRLKPGRPALPPEARVQAMKVHARQVADKLLAKVKKCSR